MDMNSAGSGLRVFIFFWRQGTMALIHSIRSEWEKIGYAAHPGDLEYRWIGLQWRLQVNPETRNPKSETRNPQPETRNLKPETRNPKPET